MRNCFDCGQNTNCVDTPSHGWLCSGCLFAKVDSGVIVLTDTEERQCDNCGDSDVKRWWCSGCADNHDYCHDDDESWCDECGDFSYVLCEGCATEIWAVCDKENCYEPVAHRYCLNHLPKDGVLFTETASVDTEGVMTVGDTVVNWS